MVAVSPHIVKSLAEGTDLDLPTDRGRAQPERRQTKREDAGVTRPRLPTPAYNSERSPK